MRILGVDPSLRSTGFGIIEVAGSTVVAITAGEIHNPSILRPALCLVKIGDTIEEILKDFRPDVVAIEGLVYVQNTRVAFTLGQVRGVIIAEATRFGLEIYEYAPRQVKRTATGKGNAGKQQVSLMMKAMLALQELPPPDAADALAIAFTHAQAKRNFILRRAQPL